MDTVVNPFLDFEYEEDEEIPQKDPVVEAEEEIVESPDIPNEATELERNPFSDLVEEQSNDPTDEEKAANPFYEFAEREAAKDKGIWQPVYDFVFSEDPSKTFMGTDGSFAKTMRSVLPSIGGKAGDTIKLVDVVTQKLSEMLPEVPEFLKGKQGLRKEAREALLSIPDTEELKEKWDEYTQGRDLPQSDKERVLDEIGTDLAQTITGAKTIEKAARMVGGAIAGNLVKEGLKSSEYGEGTQAAGKIGTMMFFNMFNPRSVKNYYDRNYATAFKNLPEGDLIDGKLLSKNLTGFERELKEGLKTVDSKGPVFSTIRDLKRNIKKGKVNPKHLVKAKYDLNEMRDQIVYDPTKNYSKAVRGRLKKNFGKINEMIDEALEPYGKQNPQFHIPYKNATQAFSGMQQSKSATRAIKRAMKDYKFASSTSALLGLTYIPGYTAAGTAAGIGALKTFELAHRAMYNPTIRKHYLDTIKAALEDNKSAIIRSAKNLDKELSEE